METQTLTVFSEKFEQIKARFKLKNTDLARMAGVSDNAITKVMKGQTESPDVRTLVAIGKKLNLSAEWILYGEGPMVKEENGADGSLKKGLQIRDELIAQLQKELWGKPEGATDDQLSNTELSFYRNLDLYKRLGLGLLSNPRSKTANGDVKVGGTQFSYAENVVITN